MTGQQEVCERFISLASDNFKEHRDIGFYADKLCITNKYLSALLKQETGMTALEWIERFVVLYAKGCLSSTTMTIQEISDDLDFPSQSVFGKYFQYRQDPIVGGGVDAAVDAVICTEFVEDLSGLLGRSARRDRAVDQGFDAVSDHHTDLVVRSPRHAERIQRMVDCKVKICQRIEQSPV